MLTFIETKLFTSLVGQYLSVDEYAGLQQALAQNPELYAKNEVESIPGHVLKKIKEEIDGGA